MLAARNRFHPHRGSASRAKSQVGGSASIIAARPATKIFCPLAVGRRAVRNAINATPRYPPCGNRSGNQKESVLPYAKIGCSLHLVINGDCNELRCFARDRPGD